MIITEIGGIQGFFFTFFGLLTASWFQAMFQKKTDHYLVKNKKWENLEKEKEEFDLLEESRQIENQFKMYKGFKNLTKQVQEMQNEITELKLAN